MSQANKAMSHLVEVPVIIEQTILVTDYQYSSHFNPFQNDKILDWSKFKEFVDNNFKFDEKCRKFCKRVENTVEQEQQIVARYARLTPSCKAGACTGQNSSMKNNKGH